MKYLWSFFLVVLFVDWLNCSSPSKDPGSRRRKNKLRAGSTTTTTQTLELNDMLNGSTTPTNVASTLSSSHGKLDVSKNEKAEPRPDGLTTSMSAERIIEVIQFKNISAVEDNGGRVVSADLNRGTLTTKSSSQRRPTENGIKETNRRKSIAFSSPLSTLSSSSLSPDTATTNEDDATSTTTSTKFISAASFRANATGVLLAVFTQRCPPEHAEGDCVSSTVASSAAGGGRGSVVVDAAALNSHPASSTTPSGLTQQLGSSSPRGSAGVVGGPGAAAAVALARAACAPCDVRQCQPVFPESCHGLIRKDSCSCCPICSSYEDAATGMLMTTPVGVSGNAGSASVCDSIRCPRGRVCLLNIQGLPMCRCPSVFQCRRLPDRPVCTTDGRTFKNRCFLGVEECVSARTLSIAMHDGRCNAEMMIMGASTSLLRQQSTPAPPTSSALRIHLQQPQILMSDERVRHQGYRVRNGVERNRQRPHRRQKQTRKHERQPLPEVATTDQRRPNAQAKRKSQGQRDSD